MIEFAAKGYTLKFQMAVFRLLADLLHNRAIISLVSGAVGAILAFISQPLRDWLYRAILTIDYEGNDDANKIEVGYLKDGKQIDEVYIRARIRNEGKRPAKNCQVFLTDLEEVHQSGTTPTSFYDPTPVAWAGWKFSLRDIPRSIPFYVDIMKVSKHTSGWLISVENLYGNQDKLQNYRGTYRFQLTATADNAKSVIYEIDVMYDGDWHNLRAIPHKK
jgi:hypothetical protein